MSGDINYLDPRSPEKPTRVIKGHNKGITSLAIGKEQTLFTGSYEGRICAWNENVPSATYVTGNCHSNQVLALVGFEEKIYSSGLDDSFRSLSVKEKTMDNQFVGTGSVPKGLAVGKNLVIVTASDSVIISQNGLKVGTMKFKFNPTACSINPSGTTAAIGAEVKVY